MLVIRDTRQHVFGCFTSESWRVAPRYYGTGESFVFQIQVRWLRVLSIAIVPCHTEFHSLDTQSLCCRHLSG